MPPDVGPAFVVAGAAAGRMLLSECLADGARAGTLKGKAPAVPKCRDEAYAAAPLWWVRESQGKAFIDYQNDATAKDLPLAAREGYRDIELAKRYTTTGMATDQGKLGNINAIAILAEATGRSMDEVSTTTFRPLLHAGRLRRAGGPVPRPSLPTGAQDAAARLGRRTRRRLRRDRLVDALVMVSARGRRLAAAASREVLATRSGVGLCDVSTLGKIDVQGKDAGEFLDKLYCNTFSTLAVGKARYGLMLREDGIVYDDGTTSRLAVDHYVMTTTTANARR